MFVWYDVCEWCACNYFANWTSKLTWINKQNKTQTTHKALYFDYNRAILSYHLVSGWLWCMCNYVSLGIRFARTLLSLLNYGQTDQRNKQRNQTDSSVMISTHMATYGVNTSAMSRLVAMGWVWVDLDGDCVCHENEAKSSDGLETWLVWTLTCVHDPRCWNSDLI